MVNLNYTVIIGCGRLGASLANTLSDNGKNTLMIDKSEKSFRKLSSSFEGLTIVGDGTDFAVLDKANLSNCDVAVVVTNNDNVNIIIAQMLKEEYGVEKVISRLSDPDRGYVYKELGIDTICPAVLSAKAINEILNNQIF